MTTPVRIGADARQQALQAALATQAGVGLLDAEGSATATIVHASSRVTQRLQADPGLWATVRHSGANGEHSDLVLDVDGEPLILRTATLAANRLHAEPGASLRIRLAGQDAVRLTSSTEPAPARASGSEPSGPGDSVVARISPQTRQLSALIEGLQQAATDELGSPSTPHAQAAALLRMGPMTADLAADPTRLASQLGRLVEQSGLFYEAHVRDWVQGKRRLHELRLEPQAQYGDTGPDATDTAPASSQPAGETAVVAPGLRALVRQQLASAASSEVTLMTQGWDEQPVALSFSAQPHTSADTTWRSLTAMLNADPAATDPQDLNLRVRQDRQARADATPSTVAAKLSMQMAALGDLDCHLVLQGDQLAVQIRHDPTSALHPHLQSLQQALQARGLKPMILLSQQESETDRPSGADDNLASAPRGPS